MILLLHSVLRKIQTALIGTTNFAYTDKADFSRDFKIQSIAFEFAKQFSQNVRDVKVMSQKVPRCLGRCTTLCKIYIETKYMPHS